MNIVVTPRLLLRPFEPDDIGVLAELYGDPDVMRYIGPVRTLEQSREKLEKMISEFANRGFGMFAVFDRKEKAFIGRCGLQPLEETGLLELGYTFIPSAWNKGFATEASKAVLQKAFEEWGLERVVAIAKPENTASIRVMQKLGMNFVRTDSFYNVECVMYDIAKKKHVVIPKRPFINSSAYRQHDRTAIGI